MHNRERLIKVIDNSACLTRRQMDDYLQKKLFPEELYVVEMHLNECPFCNDAIEGLSTTDKANVLLSTVTDFVIPLEAQSEEKKKEIRKKDEPQKEELGEGYVAQNLTQAKEAKSQPQATKNPFSEEKRESKFPYTMAIAASIAVVIAAWGIFKWNRVDSFGSKQTAKVGVSKDEEGAAILNREKIDRRQDSLMNERYAFQNQDPLEGKTVVRMERSSNHQGGGTDSGQSVAVVGSATADRSNSNDASNTNVASSNDFIGPRMPREEEAKAAPVAKAAPSRPSVESVTTTSKKKDADDSESSKAAKKAADKAKEDKAKEDKLKAEKARTEKENSDKAKQSFSQAEKDFNKGKDLYNKKKYAASISYFQSAAKVKDYSKAKQAESFIKLAKSEVLKAEREKNSKK